MPPKKGTRPWIPIPMPWEGARLTDGGMRLRLVHISGQLPDRADVRWEPRRLTATLSRMDAPSNTQSLAVHYHCVELQLSRDASGLIVIDGTTGERAISKHSRWLDPVHLRETETTLEEVFEPSEFLIPREVGS